MKDSIKLLVLSLAGLITFSCTSDDILNDEYSSVREISATLNCFLDGESTETRTAYNITSSGFETLWATGDTLGIYPIGGDQVSFPISSGVGTTSAKFDGGSWALRSTYKYAAYYPYDFWNGARSQKAIPVSYLGQVQNGNNSTAHLGGYDFMAAPGTQPSASGSVNLQFNHVGCFLRMQLTMPVAGTFTEVKIEADGGAFTTAGTVDLSAAAPALKSTASSSSIRLGLNNVKTTSANQVITLYMMVAPGSLSGKTLKFTVTDSNGERFSQTAAGKDMVATYAYNYALTMKSSGTGGSTGGGGWNDTPFVTFHAAAAQTLQMSKAIATLEYSVNNGEWKTLGTTKVSFGGTNGDLRLRGKNSYGTAKNINDDYSTISFGNSTKVECSGDIRTLVDYENFATADCSNARFCHLFSSCASLTSAPALPATKLADYCYYRMFYSCISLTTLPTLPATKLSDYCYDGMFMHCLSLTSTPALPATTLAAYCYHCMFYQCTSLTSAPALPATTLADYCYAAMFYNCESLTSAPALPATILRNYCYENMFYGCRMLNYVKMDAISIPTDATKNWLNGVASIGTFVKNNNATWKISGSSGVPQGWNVISGMHNGHEYVDLGIKTWDGKTIYWATCNIGAENPWNNGDYFAWGETATKTIFSYTSFFDSSYTLYNIDGGKTRLELNDDAAHVKWGGNWRMPTKSELERLTQMFDFFYEVRNGAPGYAIYKDNNKLTSVSVFFPFGGQKSGSTFYAGQGSYWSSSLDYEVSGSAFALFFNEDEVRYVNDESIGPRYAGRTIRPVCVLDE